MNSATAEMLAVVLAVVILAAVGTWRQLRTPKNNVPKERPRSGNEHATVRKDGIYGGKPPERR